MYVPNTITFENLYVESSFLEVIYEGHRVKVKVT